MKGSREIERAYARFAFFLKNVIIFSMFLEVILFRGNGKFRSRVKCYSFLLLLGKAGALIIQNIMSLHSSYHRGINKCTK